MENKLSPNIGYLYFKEYYRDVNFEHLKDNSYDEINKKITGYELQENFEISELEQNKRFISFSFKTTYPGLLIGSGLNHEISADDAFKLGFSFDYTSGLPVIPGSSVKGLLRSAFPEEKQKYFSEKKQYITDILKEIGVDDSINVEELRDEIFEGLRKNPENGKNKNIPLNERDIFFDAFVVGTNNENKLILGEDYITPHSDPLKNPIPVKFLKVLPGVEFEFRFLLNNGIITAKKKEELFKRIIQEIGIGAKTNVGYGNFISDVPLTGAQTSEKDQNIL